MITTTPVDVTRERALALDGLRGTYMALFVIAHVGIVALQGFWVLLTCFFVFSGFLIGSILLRRHERTGRVGWWRFYKQRGRRLLPALVLVLLTVTTWAALAGDARDRSQLRTDTLATLAFVQNWNLISQQDDYFNLFDSPSFLRHAWTLSVEEQFYVVSPLLVALLVAVVSRRAAVVLLLLGACGSAWIAGIIGAEDAASQARVYYGTDTRAGAIMVGLALAFWWRSDRSLDPRRLSVAAWVSSAAGLALAFTSSAMSPFMLSQGGLLVIALLCVPSVLAATTGGTSSFTRVFSARPLVWMGERVYGFYLWHWPVKLWADRYAPDLPLAVDVVVVFAVTAVLAAFSFRYVELPFVVHGLRAPFRWVSGRTVSVVAIAVLLIVVTVGFERADSRSGTGGLQLVEGAEVYDPNGEPLEVAMYGDSVAAGLAGDLPKGQFPGLTVHQFGGIGCSVTRWTPVMTGLGYQAPYPPCVEARDQLTQKVRDLGIDVVVMAGGHADTLSQVDSDGTIHPPLSPQHLKAFDTELDDLRRKALEGGAKEFMIATVPCRDVSGDGFAAEVRPRVTEYFSKNPGELAAMNDPIELNGHIAEWADRSGSQVLDLYTALGCDEGFTPRRQGVELYKDEIHFSAKGAALVWSWLAAQLQTRVEVVGS